MVLKKMLKGAVLGISLLVSSTCFAGLNDYPDIALLEFTNKAAVSYDISFEDASMVSDYMLEELLDSGRFNVMEREQLKGILDEHHLNLTGMVDPATAVQLGRLTGVEYLVYGSITGLSSKREGVFYGTAVYGGAGGINSNKFKVIANITARIIDLETGRIVLAAHGTGSSTSTNTEFAYRAGRRYYPRAGHAIRIGTDDISQVQVHNALAKAVNDLVNGKNGLLAKMDGKGKKRKY